jgi:hypothetical protein
LLHCVEFINGGDFSPLLSLAGVATPCWDTICAPAPSTSRPECQKGGPTSAQLRRSASIRLQVVLSPEMAPAAVELSLESPSVEKDLIAFYKF